MPASHQPHAHPPLRRSRLVVTLALLVVAGCSTALTAERRAAIKTLRIDPVVELPESVYFESGSSSMMFILPAVALIGELERGRYQREIKQRMADAGIDVSHMVRSAFAHRLGIYAPYQLVDAPPSDGSLHLKVTQIGLSSNGRTVKLRPIVTLEGELKDAAGKRIWQSSYQVSNTNAQTAGYPFKQYMEDPERIRSAFAQAIEVAVARLVDHMLDRR